jgi:hypothetical protein
MPLTFSSSNTNNKPFEIPDEGPCVGRVFRIYDLGTQQSTYQGETKLRPELSLWFEIPDQLTSDGKPKIISGTYTASLGLKSKLRPVVSNLSGKNLPDVFKDFDLKSIMGAVGVVDIIHKPRKDGGVSAYINSVGKILKGTKVAEPHNPQVFFDLGRFDLDVFNALPKYYQEKIAQSPEYKMALAQLETSKPEPAKKDDIPF